MKIEMILGTVTGRVFLTSALVFPALSNIHIALIILLIAFISDFLSGWLATYMEIKRGEKKMPPSGTSFESQKARESVIKGIGYILFILGSAGMEMLFFDRKFSFSGVSTKSLGITELAIGFCFAIELYSTLVENMKRAGLDLIGKASTLIDSVWKMINKIKGNG
jgi:hypothetical protein